ncbi:MAG: hypothetical protein AB4042_11890, partial [Leptolyngbyaceae cyanobacterium]
MAKTRKKAKQVNSDQHSNAQLSIADETGSPIVDAAAMMPLARYFGLNRRYSRSINLVRDLDKRDAVQG